MRKVFFVTFGCKVNQYETECLKSEFLKKDYLIADVPNEADVIVINSCTVTASGDSKSLYAVRKMRKINNDAVIILTGCLPQASKEVAEKIPEADIVTGTKEKQSLPILAENFIINHNRIINIDDYKLDDKFEVTSQSGFGDKTRAFVKIQDGCNQFCSYCIIPYARGRCRSKPIDELKKEICTLTEVGHKEIVLVGINLAFYGAEFGLRLVDAVEECCKINGVKRVRLGSLEPEMISDEDLIRLSKLPQFCPQFHLSLQSGCDRTLKAMNRKYNAEEYYSLVNRIKKYFPNASFTTDIMVGFPQETDDDFIESMRFAEKVGFSKVHVFQYSGRKGTVASKMSGQISKNIKEKRADEMKELAAKLREKYLMSQVGKTVPVLFERENCTDFHKGYAPDYTLIKIPFGNHKKSLRNMIFCVKIKEYESDCCIGEIVDSSL